MRYFWGWTCWCRPSHISWHISCAEPHTVTQISHSLLQWPPNGRRYVLELSDLIWKIKSGFHPSFPLKNTNTVPGGTEGEWGGGDIQHWSNWYTGRFLVPLIMLTAGWLLVLRFNCKNTVFWFSFSVYRCNISECWSFSSFLILGAIK